MLVQSQLVDLVICVMLLYQNVLHVMEIQYVQNVNLGIIYTYLIVI